MVARIGQIGPPAEARGAAPLGTVMNSLCLRSIGQAPPPALAIDQGTQRSPAPRNGPRFDHVG